MEPATNHDRNFKTLTLIAGNNDWLSKILLFSLFNISTIATMYQNISVEGTKIADVMQGEDNSVLGRSRPVASAACIIPNNIMLWASVFFFLADIQAQYLNDVRIWQLKFSTTAHSRFQSGQYRCLINPWHSSLLKISILFSYIDMPLMDHYHHWHLFIILSFFSLTRNAERWCELEGRRRQVDKRGTSRAWNRNPGPRRISLSVGTLEGKKGFIQEVDCLAFLPQTLVIQTYACTRLRCSVWTHKASQICTLVPIFFLRLYQLKGNYFRIPVEQEKDWMPWCLVHSNRNCLSFKKGLKKLSYFFLLSFFTQVYISGG